MMHWLALDWHWLGALLCVASVLLFGFAQFRWGVLNEMI